ncbi:hypothetical protein DV738_g1110, partial [Chaetothyriales sp. CBS 135597]
MISYILLVLVAIATALPGVQPPIFKMSTRNLTDNNLRKLNIDQPAAKNFQLSPHERRNIDVSENSKSLAGFQSADFTAKNLPTDSICLHPLNVPIVDNCRTLCAQLEFMQGPDVIQPLEIKAIEFEHCVFEWVNLDACRVATIDPMSSLKYFCDRLFEECVVHRLDGYMHDDFPYLGFTLSGIEAAPPYVARAC